MRPICSTYATNSSQVITSEQKENLLDCRDAGRTPRPPPVRIRVGLSHSDVRTPLDAFCTRRHPQSTDAVQRLRDSVVVQRVASESIDVRCLIRADGGSKLFVEGMPVDCETLRAFVMVTTL
jgi:hypothetical protein